MQNSFHDDQLQWSLQYLKLHLDGLHLCNVLCMVLNTSHCSFSNDTVQEQYI